jgi:hypothetical protein
MAVLLEEGFFFFASSDLHPHKAISKTIKMILNCFIHLFIIGPQTKRIIGRK